MEVPKSSPVAALYLDLGILPVQYKIEVKQLLFFKRILDKEANDPVLLSYQEMLSVAQKPTGQIIFLVYIYIYIYIYGVILSLHFTYIYIYIYIICQAYNLPLSDANIKHMDHRYWESLVKSTIN